MRTKLFIACILTCFGLTGCLEGKSSDASGGSSKPLALDAERSDRLTAAAEVLVNPVTFPKAYELFESALFFNSQNVKAGLYRALLAPAMRTRGLMARVRPYVASVSDEALADFDERSDMQLQQKDMRQFAYDNASGTFLNTEEKVQAFTTEMIADLSNLRQFLKDNRGQTIEITHRYYEDINRSDCQAIPEGDDVYTMKNCGRMRIRTFILTRPDIEMLQQMVAGWQIATVVSSAYDATGARDLIQFHQGEGITQADSIGFMRQLPKLGRLKNGQQLANVMNLGSDMVAAVGWARQMENQFCIPGTDQPADRPGAVVAGPCLRNSNTKMGPVDHLVQVAGLAMQGTMVSLSLPTSDGGTMNSDVNLAAFFRTPMTDLKRVLPRSFDRCDRAIDLGDETLGGLLPGGQASRILLPRQGYPCY